MTAPGFFRRHGNAQAPGDHTHGRCGTLHAGEPTRPTEQALGLHPRQHGHRRTTASRLRHGRRRFEEVPTRPADGAPSDRRQQVVPSAQHTTGSPGRRRGVQGVDGRWRRAFEAPVEVAERCQLEPGNVTADRCDEPLQVSVAAAVGVPQHAAPDRSAGVQAARQAQRAVDGRLVQRLGESIGLMEFSNG